MLVGKFTTEADTVLIRRVTHFKGRCQKCTRVTLVQPRNPVLKLVSKLFSYALDIDILKKLLLELTLYYLLEHLKIVQK